MTTLVVIAKECLPGRAKTRLSPPLSLQQAADVAAASLADTLLAVSGLITGDRILYFDGDAANVPPEAASYTVVPQSAGGLDERLGFLFDLCTGPTMLIGMDTPQLTEELLNPAFPWPDEVDAFFGPALDGGFWALGLREPDGSLVRGVPMSTESTGAAQLARLVEAGLTVRDLAALRDVDHIADALEVAGLAGGPRFSPTVLRALQSSRSAQPAKGYAGGAAS